jgi:hypothetical protein
MVEMAKIGIEDDGRNEHVPLVPIRGFKEYLDPHGRVLRWSNERLIFEEVPSFEGDYFLTPIDGSPPVRRKTGEFLQ